jgi:hypothetical protein
VVVVWTVRGAVASAATVEDGVLCNRWDCSSSDSSSAHRCGGKGGQLSLAPVLTGWQWTPRYLCRHTHIADGTLLLSASCCLFHAAACCCLCSVMPCAALLSCCCGSCWPDAPLYYFCNGTFVSSCCLGPYVTPMTH